MEHQPPIIDIRGDRFVVEYDNDRLKFTGSEQKFIAFADMDAAREVRFLRFLYDPNEKLLYRPSGGSRRLDAHILLVEVPVKGDMDIVAHRRALGRSDDSLNPLLQGNPAAEYTARILPRLTIHGDEFFVDFRRLELVDTIDTGNTISLFDLDERPGGLVSIDYDLSTRNVSDPYDEAYDKDSTIIVTLPPLHDLDPEGYAIISSLIDPARPAPQHKTGKKAREQMPLPTGKRTYRRQ